MCDDIECHGNGLRITKTREPVVLYHPIAPQEWVEEIVGYKWIVEFRTGGFLHMSFDTWDAARDGALRFLALDGGHGD